MDSKHFITQAVASQIDSLCKLFARKGYGDFLDSVVDRPLGEILEEHVTNSMILNGRIAPATLTTFAHAWLGGAEADYLPFVKCDFLTEYSPDKGFQIKKLTVGLGNAATGTRIRKSREIPIDNNEAILGRGEVYRCTKKFRIRI